MSHPNDKLGLFLPLALLLLCILGGCGSQTLEPVTGSDSSRTISAPLICKNASQYANQVIGDGHCVSLIKLCSGAPHTSQWRPGDLVLGQSLAPGTVIATFKNGYYPNETGYHAAIYIGQDHRGIKVWDQWVGKPVHQRLIRIRYDNAEHSNTAQSYRVVKLVE